jgi:hypothetical protein
LHVISLGAVNARTGRDLAWLDQKLDGFVRECPLSGAVGIRQCQTTGPNDHQVILSMQVSTRVSS